MHSIKTFILQNSYRIGKQQRYLSRCDQNYQIVIADYSANDV